MLDYLRDFRFNKTIIYYYQPKMVSFYGTSPPTSVKQDATYTNYLYQHSKHFVGVGSCFKGGDVKKENMAI